jgi:hypothetical protein
VFYEILKFPPAPCSSDHVSRLLRLRFVYKVVAGQNATTFSAGVGGP